MTQPKPSPPTLRDVLGNFVAEEKHDKATLDRYLTEYPEYAEELIDAAFEFEKPELFDTAPLSQVDLDRIEAGKKRFLEATAKTRDPFAAVEVSVQKHVEKLFDIPRLVIIDLLSRRIRIGSVPSGYLSRLVAALGFEESVFRRCYGGGPTWNALSYSYSAKAKPKPVVEIEFEQSLLDAGVPKERVAKILAEG